jgi:hypothetical protein
MLQNGAKAVPPDCLQNDRIKMPLYKTFSGKDKQVIRPKTWTIVRFDNTTRIPLPSKGWSIMESILRIEYPKSGCPTNVRYRLARWPNTPQEDRTGHTDFVPLPGKTRHHHWQHFLLNRDNLVVAMKIWHNGTSSITLDGRQFKTTRFK